MSLIAFILLLGEQLVWWVDGAVRAWMAKTRTTTNAHWRTKSTPVIPFKGPSSHHLILITTAAAAANPQRPACRTVADVLANELPSLHLSPVFKRIYSNPQLRGLMFIPTAEAWGQLEQQAKLQNVELKSGLVLGGFNSGLEAMHSSCTATRPTSPFVHSANFIKPPNITFQMNISRRRYCRGRFRYTGCRKTATLTCSHSQTRASPSSSQPRCGWLGWLVGRVGCRALAELGWRVG